MIITLSNNSCSRKLFEGDLTALTKNGKFIGYGQIMTKLSTTMLLKLDSKASKIFTEIYTEDLPYDLQIDT